MKNFCKFIIFSVVLMGGMVSCTDDETTTKPNPSEEEGEYYVTSDSHGFTYEYPAAIVNVGGELEIALRDCMPNVSTTVDDDTRLLVVGNLSKIDNETITRVYTNGGTIAVAFPKTADLKAFFEKNPWMEGAIDDSGMDNAILYSFNQRGEHFLIEAPSDFTQDNASVEYYEEEITDDGMVNEDVDENLDDDYINESIEEEIARPEDNHNDYYTFISTWVNALNEKEQSLSLDSGSTSDFFAPENQYVSTFEFSVPKDKARLRKVVGCTPDSLHGSGSMMATYKIRQIHVYENNPGAGDYYIMEMTTQASHVDMYKGNSRNKHGGIYTKWCGWYCKKYTIKGRLLNEEKKAVADLMFNSNPRPDNESLSESVKYTSSSSTEIGASLSIAGGWSQKKGWNAEAKGEVSGKWSWSKSDQYTVTNSAIVNASTVPGVGWGQVYGNLPVWDSHYYKIKDFGNSAYQGLGSVTGRWIWYEPDKPDNVDRKSYYIETTYEIEYGALTHVYSTTKEHTIKFTKKDTIQIKAPMETKTVGIVNLTNNFKDRYIRRVEVYDTKDSVLFGDYTTMNPEEKRNIGAIFTNQKCTIKLVARKSGNDPDEKYVYSTNDILPLKAGVELNLTVKGDFKKVE